MTARQRLLLAASLLTQAFAVGLTHGIFPVFLEPLEASFGAPRTVIASGAILIMLALSGSSLVTGLLFDRGRGRRVMLGGAWLLATGLALASQASSLGVLGLAGILMGMSVPSLGPLSGATLVTRFFAAERGRALGWVGMGPPLGAGIFAGLASLLLTRMEWRSTLLLFAAGVGLLLVPLIAYAIPGRFDGREDARGAGPTEAAATTGAGGDSRSFVREPAFWWTAAMFALAAGISTGWTMHFAAFLAGQGVSEATRAGLLSLQFWMAAPGSFLFGALGDRLRPSGLLVATLLGQGGILALLSQSTAEAPFAPAVFIGLVVVSGLLSGGLIPLFLLLLGRRVRATSFSRALGVSNLLMLPVMAGSVLLAAQDFEWTGNYRRALVWLAAGHLAAIASLFVSNRVVRARG